MNTYITYGKLQSLVHPYFLTNWWEDFMTWWELQWIIALSIQDLINNSSFSFMAEFNKVTPKEKLYEDTYSIFETKHPINRVHELLIEWRWDRPGTVVARMPYFNTDEFFYKRWTNILYGPKDIKFITINYEKEFEINNMATSEELKQELPIPFTFIPALIKMIYDTSSMFTFFQGEGDSTDFYGHWKTRLNDLVNSDELSSKTNIRIWEQ